MLEDFPSPYHTLTEGGHTPGEGADFLLGEVTDTVTRVRTEQGLLTYLSCLKALGGAPHLRSLKAITRLRLQSELYSLTSPGGGWAEAGARSSEGAGLFVCLACAQCSWRNECIWFACWMMQGTTPGSFTAHSPESATLVVPPGTLLDMLLCHNWCLCVSTAARIYVPPGGPYYAPRSVRSAALEVLDALFPMGRRSRRLVRLVFRVLHPAEFLGGVVFLLLLPVRLWSWLTGRLIGIAAMVLMTALRLVGLAKPRR